MMNRLLSLLCCASALPALAADLAPAALDGSLWSLDDDGVFKLFSGARYADVDEQTKRFPRQSELSFGELSIGELLLTQDKKDSRPLRLRISVYNKGDDGVLDKKEFETLLSETLEALNATTGVKNKPRKMLKRDTGIKLNARVWETEGCVILLEAAASGKRNDFTAEFIRLSIGPDKESIERGGAQDVAHRNSLRDNRKEEENGNVWIEGIPMVDQGQKGYCVPASVSRVFAYYGMDGVDQHALAALCKSKVGGGTSVNTMEKALEDISRSFHIRITPLDKGSDFGDFISAYNATAKKMKKPTIDPRSEERDYDPNVLLAARAAKDITVRKWMKPIVKAIDAGLPVLWSVQLAFPEQGIPQSGGGHMRLIIGYNEEEGTIIYSDSWGERHEKKEMPARQACAMTVRRYVLKPTR